MKTRTGFVSNSSTCSFVLIGYREEPSKEVLAKISKHYGKELDEELLENDGHLEVLKQLGLSSMYEEDLWGELLLYISSDGDNIDVTDDLLERIEAFQKLTKELGLPKPKIYSGITCC